MGTPRVFINTLLKERLVCSFFIPSGNATGVHFAQLPISKAVPNTIINTVVVHPDLITSPKDLPPMTAPIIHIITNSSIIIQVLILRPCT